MSLRRRRVGSQWLAATVGLLIGPQPADADRKISAEHGAFQIVRYRDGGFLCRSEWELRHEGADIVLVERGEGPCHGFDEPVYWETRTRFAADDPRQLREASRTISTIDRATVLKTTARHYDPAKRTVTARWDQPGDSEPPRAKSWTVDGVATTSTLPFLVRGALAGGERSGTTMLATGDSVHPVRWTVRGQEQVTVPAGTFQCVKVELLIQLGLLSWARRLLPRLYLWYTADPPYHWVKYEGLEDGLRSPRVAIERLSPVE